MTALEFNHAVLGLRENLRYFALSLTSDHEDADDLVQDTFVKVFSNKDKFNPSTNLKAWVYTIMKNTFINKYRRKTKIQFINDSTNESFFINQSNSTDHVTPASKLNHDEMMAVLQGLEDAYRVPFEMYYNGFKYKEIAEELDLSIGTVKSRIFFSRKKLMEQLEGYEN